MEEFGLDGETFTLTFGDSFNEDSDVKFQSLRYDFKPASVDAGRDSTLEVDGNSVSVVVPTTEGSAMVFKGNRKPTTRDCFLIVDPENRTVTLEKCSYLMTVKSTRIKQGLPGQKLAQKLAQPPASQTDTAVARSQPEPKQVSPVVQSQEKICDNLSASSSSDSDSDNDSVDSSDKEDMETDTHASEQKPVVPSVITEDLQLSESDSESDNASSDSMDSD